MFNQRTQSGGRMIDDDEVVVETERKGLPLTDIFIATIFLVLAMIFVYDFFYTPIQQEVCECNQTAFAEVQSLEYDGNYFYYYDACKGRPRFVNVDEGVDLNVTYYDEDVCYYE